MKAASLHEIKKEVSRVSDTEYVDLILKLARFKKENKELLSYLLFYKDDEVGYIKDVQQIITQLFESLNLKSAYLTKKSIRKILRETKKYIRYSKDKRTSVELLIFYCQNLCKTALFQQRNTVVQNIMERTMLLIHKEISSLHEDLQYDYRKELEQIAAS